MTWYLYRVKANPFKDTSAGEFEVLEKNKHLKFASAGEFEVLPIRHNLKFASA